MYLTYSEYIEMGGELDELIFNRYAFSASKVVDKITFNRVSNMEIIPEAVKMCIYELIQQERVSDGVVTNITKKLDSSDGTGLLTSFTTDGYQESYNTGSGNTGEYVKTMITNTSATQQDTVRKYLEYVYDDYGVPLLYRGVY